MIHSSREIEHWNLLNFQLRMRNAIFGDFAWAITPTLYNLAWHAIAHFTPIAKLYWLLQSVFEKTIKKLDAFFSL